MAPKRLRNGQPKPSVRKEVIAVLNSRVEHKHFVRLNAFSNYSATGGTSSLSTGVILGDGSTQRDGVQIKPETLKIRWVSQNTSSILTEQARLIVFQDRQANGTLTTVTELLNTADVNSQYNPVTMLEQKRFRILCDRTMDLNPYVAGPAIHTMEMTFKPSGPITFLDTTDVTTACGRNVINFLVIGTAATSQYAISWDLGYTDS